MHTLTSIDVIPGIGRIPNLCFVPPGVFVLYASKIGMKNPKSTWIAQNVFKLIKNLFKW